MKTRVNCYDVARMAGVSQATVSYVLTRREGKRISEETRLKVLHAADELGYHPSMAAKTLATGKTGTIALWLPLIHQSVFNHVAGGIVESARSGGLNVMIVQGQSSDSLAKIGLLSPTNVDAILAHDATGLVNDILDRPQGSPPIVSFGPAYSDRTDHVGIDLHAGSLDAVRHLFQVGCRRVAYAGHRDNLHEEDPRFRAYLKILNEFDAQPELIPLTFGDYEAGYRSVKEHIKPNSYPDGLFCWNDEVAIGASSALSDLGLRVPQDVAIIGSDGIRETAFFQPSISTVAQPFSEMCDLVWAYLRRRLEEPACAIQSAVLPMKLVQRASTKRE